TTSLPEEVGAEKNWDYRYCWLRDASFIVRALFGLGYHDEAEAFVSWLLHTTRLTRPRLHVLYDIFGETVGAEHDVPLAGYRDSRPVRVGNQAEDQLQLDVYGEVIDAACQYINQGGLFDRETERMLIGFGNYVCENWREPDEGIWEIRTGRVHHVHSRVLCWTALDRLIELHRKGHLGRAPVERFIQERTRIEEEVRTQGWSEEIQSYVQVLGTRHVDAALLLIPWYGFEHSASPRMKKTYQRIRKELHADGALLYRYSTQGGKREGAFGICSFWEAEFLARGGGTLAEARTTFEDLLRYGNDLGLFSEEIDPRSGGSLGNFPQGFTHVGLINAALAIRERIHGRTRMPHHDLPLREHLSGGRQA
ncbi:MAG TPA: glycoside hydrolase family 15 protein, partial [Vulgatibacter sp.]